MKVQPAPPFVPTRAAGIERLSQFVANAGQAYARHRNHDLGPADRQNVSMLSPHVRHRLVTEAEIVDAVLRVHSKSEAEKFIQEVCWRTYWKGWLEMRPQVWANYCRDLADHPVSGAKDATTASGLDAALAGQTEIGCFDAWVTELKTTGYLHNHTRMWFASIWIHTLGLPWQLGADFFMRHLLDGDPASNTLSWRWVGGLQTVGKTYLARPDNIETYTGGRFRPTGQLATVANALVEPHVLAKPTRLAKADVTVPGERVVLLLTEDDLNPETWPIARRDIVGAIGLRTSAAYDGVSPLVQSFKQAALADAIARVQAHFVCPVLVHDATQSNIADLAMGLAVKTRAEAFVQMHAPVGPTADQVGPVAASLTTAGWPIRRLRREWDTLFWPHATHGFFKLKAEIPSILSKLEESRAPRLPF